MEGILKSYCEVVNYLLEKYASDEIIGETTAEIKSWKQQEGKKETKLWKKLWDKVLRCGKVYEEYHLKGIFI